ncbi:choline-sulfatase [Skermanella stibiiresistens SB22]|uniref:Choline-sulfatase n=2 Tax=Skermanella TaxID=204447 RepID=W9H9T2_9PROT|nr:choline-sulfatase [Skermanella stibiiresistens SB22]
MAGRPNILILMADQLTPAVLAAYGGGPARTPNIDALSAGGVTFDSAYCNSPLCAPSRYVFMSGRLPSAIGAYDNSADFPSDIPTFAHYLRHAGYQTILSGKMHFCGPDQLHGFEQRLTTDIYPADYGWTPDWDDFQHRPSWYHNMSSVTEAGPCVRTNQLDFDEEVVFAARRKLFDMARARDERPFCMVVSMTHPHDPYAITEEYWNRHTDDEITPPRVAVAPDRLDPHSLRLRHVCDMDNSGITERHVHAARRAYCGAVSFIDDQIGILMAALRDSGQAENTVVILLSDHGEMLGERGLWYKMSFFEGACRIPLIVNAPGRFAPRRVRHAVSSIDLLPTLVELAHDGTAPPYATPIEGRSLLPHLNGTGGHDEVIGEYLAEGAIAPIVMIRRGTEKFIHSPVDPDQFHDLAEDPDELVNLAEAPALADAVAAYRAEVAERWDLAALRAEVVESQRRRRLVYDALCAGARHSWDHQPVDDASQQYMRNHIDLDDLEAMARFPPVRPR